MLMWISQSAVGAFIVALESSVRAFIVEAAACLFFFGPG